MSEQGIGLIGLGRWGRQHLKALNTLPGFRLAGMAARSPETVKAAELEFKAPAYQDYHQLLARPEVDAVIIAVPNYLHYPVAKDALLAGKHVLLEKPMALNESDCDSLIRLAAQQNKILFIGHEFRQFAIWAEVKRLLDSGVAGEIKFGDLQLWRYPYRSGSGGWKQDPAKVGNWLLEEPVHYFDLACWFMTGREPRSLYARASSRSPEQAHLFENFSALLDFNDGSYVNITRVITAYNFSINFRFTGTAGVLKASWQGETDVSETPTARITLYTYREKVEQEIPVTQQTGHAFELGKQTAAFLAAIRGEQPPTVDGQAGKKAVVLCQAALASLQQNRVIDLG